MHSWSEKWWRGCTMSTLTCYVKSSRILLVPVLWLLMHLSYPKHGSHKITSEVLTTPYQHIEPTTLMAIIPLLVTTSTLVMKWRDFKSFSMRDRSHDWNTQHQYHLYFIFNYIYNTRSESGCVSHNYAYISNLFALNIRSIWFADVAFLFRILVGIELHIVCIFSYVQFR